MAHLPNGLLGGFLGTVGNIEGYMLNGKYVIRSRRKKSTKPPTEKQLACRQKMKIISRFFSAFVSYVQVGFANATSKTSTGYNAAIAYHLKYAIAGQYPDYNVDYEKVRVSEGLMSTKDINAAVTIQDNKLIFTWTPNLTYAHSNDRVMLLAYAPALNEAVYTVCGAKRMSGTDVLILHDDTWKGIAVEIHLSFISENRTQCTNSIYLGQLLTSM